ncbi:S-adenosylmethionine decarboxylase proenzyme, partial [Galemys pyrenaicus]
SKLTSLNQKCGDLCTIPKSHKCSITDNHTTIYRKKQNSIMQFSRMEQHNVVNQPNQTLKILMSEHDSAIMGQFYRKMVLQQRMSLGRGIHDVIPGSGSDAMLFNS